jgi:hypothetical protein
MADIVVVGSLNMDLVVKAPRMPLAGETIPGEDLQLIPGGKGANQAAAAARLGSPVAMVGRVGNDAFGPRLIENLGRQGVDTSHVVVDDGAATGTAMIIVDDTGENSIVISAGANGRVNKRDMDCAEGLLSRAGVLLLQFEVPLETVEVAIEMAARHQVKVILNPAPARPVPPGFLARVDCLVDRPGRRRSPLGRASRAKAPGIRRARGHHHHGGGGGTAGDRTEDGPRARQEGEGRRYHGGRRRLHRRAGGRSDERVSPRRGGALRHVCRHPGSTKVRGPDVAALGGAGTGLL